MNLLNNITKHPSNLIKKYLQSEKFAHVACINPHSFVVSENDPEFRDSLEKAEILICDGIGTQFATKFLFNNDVDRFTGFDSFKCVMDCADKQKSSILFIGSTDFVLSELRLKVAKDYSNLGVIDCYSPPFKVRFEIEDIFALSNNYDLMDYDIIFLGLSAPKQELYAELLRDYGYNGMVLSIGAVFDFYSGNVDRAPKYIRDIGLEWLHRSVKDPKRLGKRNLISNPLFLFQMLKFKISNK